MRLATFFSLAFLLGSGCETDIQDDGGFEQNEDGASPAFDGGSGPRLPVGSIRNISTIAAGPLNVCWIGDDDSIACSDGSSLVNTDGFVQVQAGFPFVCGLTATGRIECTQGTGLSLNAGTYVDMAANGGLGGCCHTVCGIAPSGNMDCERRYEDTMTPLEGAFFDLDVNSEVVCALSAVDSRIQCWGADVGLGVPTTEFSSVNVSVSTNSPAPSFVCALGIDKKISCWGRNDDGRATPPSGEFSTVHAGGDHACALDLEGFPTCWGRDDVGQASPPENIEFAELALGLEFSCGRTVGGRVMCWGDSPQLP